jgi:hypothetical protein
LEIRFKPYLAWSKREEWLRAKTISLKKDKPKNPEEQKATRLYWAIVNGRSHAFRLKPLAEKLRPVVAIERPDDKFRAELLLGYLAGLPPAVRKPADEMQTTENDSTDDREEGEA